MTERWLRVTSWTDDGATEALAAILDSDRRAHDLDWFLRSDTLVTIVTNTEDYLVANGDEDDQRWIYIKL